MNCVVALVDVGMEEVDTSDAHELVRDDPGEELKPALLEGTLARGVLALEIE